MSGEDESHELGLMTPNNTVTYIAHSLSSELETDQREGIRDQLRFAEKQLDDRVCL